MSTEIEKESRLMITHEEYIAICADILKSNPYVKSFSQTNYYFDTEDFYLTKNHHVVRIRDKLHSFELTYKVKGEDGDLEINQDISIRLAHKYLKGGSIPHGEVYNKIALLGLSPKKLKVVASLYTRRVEVEYPDYLFVIDMNSYDDVEDFNIEIESKTSVKHAEEVLKKYCKQYHLTYQKEYTVKSARVIKLAMEKSLL